MIDTKPKLALIQSREVSEETVDVLKYLLSEATAGNVRGIAFVALHNGHEFSSGIIGKPRLVPVLTRGMVRALDDELRVITE